jgi:hypothetical protein
VTLGQLARERQHATEPTAASGCLRPKADGQILPEPHFGQVSESAAAGKLTDFSQSSLESVKYVTSDDEHDSHRTKNCATTRIIKTPSATFLYKTGIPDSRTRTAAKAISQSANSFTRNLDMANIENQRDMRPAGLGQEQSFYLRPGGRLLTANSGRSLVAS